MLVIPAIDIKEGKCVRLKQGRFSEVTIYSESPVETAESFHSSGAKRLHLVDLDGARGGESVNGDIVQKILTEIKIPIQLGGGIRSLEDIEYWLNLGVSSVILGTAAVKNPAVVEEALKEFDPERIIVAVDAKDGKVAVEGWQEASTIEAVDLALRFQRGGLKRLLYTDIERDGMLNGPNLVTTKRLAQETKMSITASGGVASKQDLQKLTKLEPFGVDSVIVGRAFYEGRILPEEVL